MPKKLFFKLPAEKQQKILNAAAEEFIEYKENYKKSSVNRITEKADIAIGSIYKYFYDKNDLFMYLFEQHRKRPTFLPDSETFYAYSTKQISMGDSFTPTGQILLDIVNITPALFHDLVFESRRDDKYLNLLYTYIQSDQAKGYLRESFDDDIITYLYSSLEYIAYQYRQNKGLDESAEREIFKKMADVFFFGLYKDGIEDEIR